MKTFRFVAPLLLLACAGVVNAEISESGWIDLVKGSLEDVYGAEVREVEAQEGEGTKKLTIAIPKVAISDPAEIEEVLVVGQKPAEPEPLLDVQYHWVEDYENDHYGLIIYLSEDMSVPIRLYLHSDEGFIR